MPKKKTLKKESNDEINEIVIEKEDFKKHKIDVSDSVGKESVVAAASVARPKKNSSGVAKKIKLFDSIAKYSLYVLVALLPIFFLPTSLIELGQAKLGLFVLAITVASISLGISSIYSKSIKIIDKKILIPIILISATTFLSSLLSTSYKGGIMGLGNELDSWYAISIFLFAIVLISSVINTKERIFKVFSLFWISFGLASLFQILRFAISIFGMEKLSGLLSLGGLFSQSSINTIGTWADFGIVAAVAALSLAVTLDMVPLKDSVKKLFWGLFVVFAIISTFASSVLVGSGIDQLNNGSKFVIPSATVVGLIAFIFALFRLIHRRQEQKKSTIAEGGAEDESSKNTSIKFPVASFVLIIIGLIIMISPLALNQKINHVLGVPNESVLNIRPGFSDTCQVAKSVVSSSVKNSLLGVGPHGFYIVWNQYRPDYINNLEMWNTDLQTGVGYLPTILVNNGIFAFLLWIVSLVLLFFISLKSIFKRGKKDVSFGYSEVVIFLSTLLLWINMIINVSGSAVVILTFIMTGLLVSNLVLDKKLKASVVSFNGVFEGEGVFAKKVTKDQAGISIIIIFIILILCLAFLWVQRTRAQAYSAQSMQIIYAKTATISAVPKAMELLKKSFDIYPADIYARGINNLALVKVNYDITSDPLNQNLQGGQRIQMSESTQEYLNLAISSGKDSVDLNPNDFRNLLQFGSTMQTVALITGEGETGKLALQSMLQAQSLASNHPLPLYTIANLYILAGDKESALSVLRETLRLKPNFAEASEVYQNILNSINEASSTNATSSVSSATSTPSVKAKAGTSVKPTIKPAVKPAVKKSTTTSKTTIKAPVKKAI